MAQKDAPPRWDHGVRRRLARGEAAALGECYDRFAPLVHGLAHRVLGEEEAADSITREVFARLWEDPGSYDPRRGSLRSWLALRTHLLAVERLRATETAALRPGGGRTRQEVERTVRGASVAARADRIVTSMPPALRDALERAYFQRRDHHQTAADLGITPDEARSRLRLGLHLLSAALETDSPGTLPPEAEAGW
ncbi:sigma factor [Streptomyces sp. NPDC048664]|uniref:sigma factor n=1 Tax=Streptomyces sp. NPDC048664 TaxID=3154505 RepID=UPI00342F3DD3